MRNTSRCYRSCGISSDAIGFVVFRLTHLFTETAYERTRAGLRIAELETRTIKMPRSVYPPASQRIAEPLKSYRNRPTLKSASMLKSVPDTPCIINPSSQGMRASSRMARGRSREGPLVAEPAPPVPDVERVPAPLRQRAPVQPLDQQKVLGVGPGSNQADDVGVVQSHQETHFELQLLRSFRFFARGDGRVILREIVRHDGRRVYSQLRRMEPCQAHPHFHPHVLGTRETRVERAFTGAGQ